MAQTPQRPLPGAFLATPAPNRVQTSPPQPPSALRSVSYPSLPKDFGRVSQPAPAQSVASPAPAAPENLKPLQRAAGTINETLDQEKRYPELDSYVGRMFADAVTRMGVMLMRLQRGSPPNIISHRPQQRRHFRKPRPTISPRRFSNNIIELKYPR